MEIVKLRLILVAVVMTVFGVAFSLRKVPEPLHRTEAWVQESTPTTVGAFRALPGPNGEKQTYRLPQATYDLIAAYGVDSLVFTDGRQDIDVCVVASNNRESFHDPSYCFPGSGWQIVNARVVQVPTKTRGTIPFSVVRAKPSGGKDRVAAYTYKGPISMATSAGEIYLQWSRVNFLSGEPQEGAFYRFIGDESMSEPDLLRFASDFMDAIKVTSKGVM